MNSVCWRNRCILWMCCRRKHDAMMPHNLFSLITDRLMLNSSGVTLATYNVLLEVQRLWCRWITLFVLKYSFIQLWCYPELNLCSFNTSHGWSSNVQLRYVPIHMVLMYTVNHKKRDVLFLTITFATLNRFL